MRKILIGTAIGVGAAAVVYLLYKQGKLDGMKENLDELASKAKRNLKNAADMSKNQVEYLTDLAEQEFSKVKEKLDIVKK